MTNKRPSTNDQARRRLFLVIGTSCFVDHWDLVIGTSPLVIPHFSDRFQ